VKAAEVEQQVESSLNHLAQPRDVACDEACPDTLGAAWRRAIARASGTISTPVTSQPCRAR
jgi:hypothetical protein